MSMFENFLENKEERERERDEGIFTVTLNSLSVSVILNHLCFAPERKLFTE